MNSKSQLIFINGRFLTHPMSGVERTATETLKALEELAPSGFEFVLLCPKGVSRPAWIRNIQFRSCGILQGHLWEQVELPFYSRDGFLVSLCNTAPLLKRNQLVRIHDASVFSVPDSYSFAFRTWYRFLFRGLCLSAQTIITDSDFSKQELIQHCHADESKIKTVYLGVDHMGQGTRDEKIYGKLGINGKPYILIVGSQNVHKNLAGLLNALPYLDPESTDVVVCGDKNSKIFATAKLESSFPLIHAGRVSDEELSALYQKAACFVFPSFYEGFGLPPLEAMASGCPVVASHVASLPEVCGEAALYCDPKNPEDISRKIIIFLNSSSLRKEYAEKGRQQAQRFTWRKSVEGLLSLF